MNKPPLTWNAVLDLVRKSGSQGMTNTQIAAALDALPARVTFLTLIMYEAGELWRVPPDQRTAGSGPIVYTLKKP